ncbi:MAG TPA: acylphosphatase [Gammaproteobacteria bacterium]
MSASSRQALRCVVAGRVQGVYYRAATADEAGRLGLDGWVKNLADGRVEVVASGEPAAIAALVQWLWKGPPAARVDAVHVEEWTTSVPRGFAVAK